LDQVPLSSRDRNQKDTEDFHTGWIIEEPELLKRLGKDYIAYCQQTPMFLPTMQY
jgi:hypothetical protein